MFKVNSFFWRIMERIADIALLSVMWIMCSLTIILAPLATLALFYVTSKIQDRTSEGTIKEFFSYLGSDFAQNLKVSSIVVIPIVVLLLNASYIMKFNTTWAFLYTIVCFIIASLLTVFGSLLFYRYIYSRQLSLDQANAIGTKMIKEPLWGFLIFTILCLVSIAVSLFLPLIFVGPGIFSFSSLIGYSKIISNQNEDQWLY